MLGKRRNKRKDTLQAKTSDVRLDEVQVFVPIVVLLLQCADGIALVSHEMGVTDHIFIYVFFLSETNR